MTKIDESGSPNSAALEAQRRAEEEARRAAEARRLAEEARRAAEAQRAAAAAAAQNNEKLGISASAARGGFKRIDELSTGKGSALRNLSLRSIGSGPAAQAQPLSDGRTFSPSQLLALQRGAGPKATSLHDEVMGDGQANCLEKATQLAGPNDTVVLLADQRDATGHAVVKRPDGSVVDPNDPSRKYGSLDDYAKQNPHYGNPVEVKAKDLKHVLAAPPGAERERRIANLGLTGAAARRVADPAGAGAVDHDQRRAGAASAQFVADQVKHLSPEEQQKVKDAAKAVHDAQSSSADPQARAEAVAAALAQQSAQLANDPKLAQAFANSVAYEVQAIAGDLGKAKNAGPALKSLAEAAGNLGETGGLQLGRQLANGLPEPLPAGFDQALGDVAKNGGGGRTLLFATAQGLELAGKPKGLDALKRPMNETTQDIQPAMLVEPIDPNDPDAVGKAGLQLAQARWSNPANVGPGGQDAQYLRTLAAQQKALAGNPEVLQQVMQGQRGAIAEVANRHLSDGQAMNPLFRAAEAAGNGEVEKLAKQFASQTSGRSSTGGNDVNATIDPKYAAALAVAYQEAGKPESAADYAARAAQPLDAAQKKAYDASKKVGELEAKLEKQLATVGGAMTPEQKQAYQKKFWADHQPELDAKKAANEELATYVKGNLESLKKLAATNQDVAKGLADSLGVLAKDPSKAQFVKETVGGLATEGGKLPDGFKASEKTLAEAFTTASTTLANEALANGDHEGALAQVKQAQEWMKATQFSSPEVQELVKKSLPTYEGLTKAIEESMKAGDTKALEKFLKDPRNAEALAAAGHAAGHDPLLKAFTNLSRGVAMGGLIYKISNAKDPQTALAGISSAGAVGAELLEEGAHGIANMLRQSTSEALKAAEHGAHQLTKVLGKAAPVLNLIASAAWLGVDTAKMIKDPNVKTGLHVASDLLFAASAAAAMSGNLPVATATAIAGAVTALGGHVYGEYKDVKELKEDKKKFLTGIFADSGMPPADAEKLAKRIAESELDLNQLATNAGLTPDQVLEVMKSTPALESPHLAAALPDLARLSGLKGAAFVEWLKSVDQKAPGLGNALETLHRTGGVASAEQSGNDRAAQWVAANPNVTGAEREKGIAQAYREGYDETLKAQAKNAGLLP
ncbi:MAG: hypothetical protein JNK82_04865 [Myxococcaceae bacterium]|nr:hypothetical protein [Myxococcaceae bacterium]